MNHFLETTKFKDIANKRWLILSHGFNMDGRASSQTITDKMPYLLEAGIQPTVFSAITGIKDGRFPHKQYLAWGPAAFRFDFRHWVANKYGRGTFYKLLTGVISFLLAPFIGLEKLLLGYSSQWSWAMPAFINGYRLIRAGKVDLVYSTGGAWSAHLAGLWLKQSTDVKWIAEIHDPLVIRSDPVDEGFAAPRNRDARFRKSLETNICKLANAVWWFTDGALHYAKIRNPILNTKGNARGFMVLPGAEPPGGLASDRNHLYGTVLNLAHSGSLAKDRSISTILHALHSLIKKYPEARQQIRIHIYGAPLDSLTKESLEKYQYHDVLIDHGRLERDPVTGISGRERVVQALQRSDALILLHGNDEWCAEYIPSKFYEYLWTGRPIWGITHRNPQLDQMLLDRSSYLSHESDKLGIEMTLERIWLDWQKRVMPTPTIEPIGVRQAVATILNTI